MKTEMPASGIQMKFQGSVTLTAKLNPRFTI